MHNGSVWPSHTTRDLALSRETSFARWKEKKELWQICLDDLLRHTVNPAHTLKLHWSRIIHVREALLLCTPIEEVKNRQDNWNDFLIIRRALIRVVFN